MEVPRRESQEREGMDHVKPSSVCVAEEKAAGKGPGQRTVLVFLWGVIMETSLLLASQRETQRLAAFPTESTEAACVGREDWQCSVDGGDLT